MSVRVMGAVWELDLPAPQKLVLLALADHADHEGGSVHPMIPLVAHKVGLSVRHTFRIVRELEASGLLVRVGGGRGRGKTVHYRVDVTAGKKHDTVSPFGADTMTGCHVLGQESLTGCHVLEPENMTSATGKHDIPLRAHVDKKEPSVNRQENGPPTPQGGGRPTARFWPTDFALDEQRRRVAERFGVDAEAEWAHFRDKAAAKGYKYVDWDAAWRNWCRSDYQRPTKAPGAETLARPSGLGTAANGGPDEATRDQSRRWLDRHRAPSRLGPGANGEPGRRREERG